MAAVAKSTKASFDASTLMVNPLLSGKIAGEDIPVLCPCYLHTDNKVYKASGAAANAAAVLYGWSCRAAKLGQPVTLAQGPGPVAKYSDGLLTPGQKLYLGAAGALDTAATTGDAVGIAQAFSADLIRLTRAI